MRFWYALMGALLVLDGMAGLRASLHLALTGLVALILYKALKRWTKRPRPFASDVRIRAWVAPLDEFSFPSGHTLHAVAFSLVAMAHYPLLAWLLVPFTASVAASRVMLGLHISDVFATAIGALAAWRCGWCRGLAVRGTFQCAGLPGVARVKSKSGLALPVLRASDPDVDQLDHHLARQLGRALRGVVDERGDDRRRLLEVVGHRVVLHVQVRVVDVAEVVQLVLHELEAGDADAVKTHVIGAAGVALGHDGCADVIPRLQPVREDRRDRQVFLGVDPADLAAAVVEVEVGGDLP
jgi:undecaprenyl-diphosphatase